MRYLLSLILALTCLAVALPTAHAAKAIKAAKPTKELLVLMPLRVADEDKSLQGSMETALVQGLQQKYEVLSGEQVATKAKAIFLKESRNTSKKECDETRCMQDIAAAFQAELIATANVTKRSDGYFLALSVQNIFDNRVVYSNSVACKNCDAYEVVDKLKELSSASAQAALAIVTPDLSAPIPADNKNDLEAVLWVEAQKGNTVDDYQVYLDSYPKGKYLPFAKARIKKIKDAAAEATEQQQQQAWDTAQQENSEASYGNYLKVYPAGRFAGFAKVRLDKLKNDVAAKDEAALWANADNSNDQNTIQSYLNTYPRGRYVAAAHAKLKLIAEEAAKGPAMVRIPGKNYELGKYEVTQAEWKSVMGNNPSSFTKCGDTCPVEQVSWDDIQTFLQKLNAKTGRQFRLPSEAEWEYACYGGSRTEYCGGNDVNAVAWYDKNSKSTAQPAGQKQANGYGLYDMSGNVWEWMEDADGKGVRVLRGGSWNYNPKSARAASRFSYGAANRYYSYGFRLARTLKEAAAFAATAEVIPGRKANMLPIPGKNYELGKYEVTQAEWKSVMGSNPSYFTKCGDTCPVEQVSWDDIQTFLQKLNAKTGRQYRLPSEAEWEYACYGGNRTEYCGGNDVNAVAWYDKNSKSTAQPAGQKQANGYGLYDMSGNVWEWMEDADGKGVRVLRGGSFNYNTKSALAASRFSYGAAKRYYSYGFRLARTLP